jgi:hypothetical protein
MDTKLDFEQRHRANDLLEKIINEEIDLESFVFEFVATRDAYNKLNNQAQKLKYALEHYAHGGSNYGNIARKALGFDESD